MCDVARFTADDIRAAKINRIKASMQNRKDTSLQLLKKKDEAKENQYEVVSEDLAPRVFCDAC